MNPYELPSIPPPDAALLDRFLSLGADLHALAADTGRPLSALLAWAAAPAVAAWLAAYEPFRLRALETRAATHRQAALDALLTTLTTPEDPHPHDTPRAPASHIERRHAAVAILRAVRPAATPRRAERPLRGLDPAITPAAQTPPALAHPPRVGPSPRATDSPRVGVPRPLSDLGPTRDSPPSRAATLAARAGQALAGRPPLTRAAAPPAVLC